MTPSSPSTPRIEEFWTGFAEHHRLETASTARILAHKKLTREQFAQLLASGTSRMSPSKARHIWDWLKENQVLDYPDEVEDNAD